ncbi:hypothetical protein HGA34_03150 [Candidatus Falkowbacteria bacterium]|nr:hypothetical protein [Candidatus Falkowbacteria bacterium]
MTYKNQIFFLALAALLVFPAVAQAAEARIFLSSGAGAYPANKDLTTRLMINSGGGAGINAAEGVIKFDPKKIKVKKIIKDGSIFDLWAKQPAIDNQKGEITFSGGTTKAFTGSLGLIFKVQFSALSSGSHSLEMSTSTTMALAANGLAENITKDVDGGDYIFGNTAVISDAEKIRNKMVGRILLQVEKSGRSWYVFPGDRMRYFLGRPADAFNLMRKLGLGVNHAYIKKYENGIFPSAVSGKILLDVEDSGKAYYINPTDKKAYYLGRPADAFQVMRKLGLGISNDLIKKIPDWAI